VHFGNSVLLLIFVLFDGKVLCNRHRTATAKPLAPILKNDTDSQHTKQEQSKPLKSQLTTKVCFAHAFLPTLKKDYVI